LVRVTLAVLEVPIVMDPKFKLVGLGVSWPGVRLTESMAGLLIALPTELLTTTVMDVPSSDAVVASDV
jgi:hypothetical protein